MFSESRDVTNLAEVYSVVIEDALSMCSSSEELTKIGALIMEPGTAKVLGSTHT